MKTFFKLIEVENEHAITKSTDSAFLLLIQRAALLSLKATGYLNEMQYRQADEALLQQHREDVRAICIEAERND